MVFDHTQHKDKKSCLATDMLLQAGLIAAPGCAFLADTSHLCLCQVHPSGLGVQSTPTVAVFTLFVSLTPILTTPGHLGYDLAAQTRQGTPCRESFTKPTLRCADQVSQESPAAG